MQDENEGVGGRHSPASESVGGRMQEVQNDPPPGSAAAIPMVPVPVVESVRCSSDSKLVSSMESSGKERAGRAARLGSPRVRNLSSRGLGKPKGPYGGGQAAGDATNRTTSPSPPDPAEAMQWHTAPRSFRANFPSSPNDSVSSQPRATKPPHHHHTSGSSARSSGGFADPSRMHLVPPESSGESKPGAGQALSTPLERAPPVCCGADPDATSSPLPGGPKTAASADDPSGPDAADKQVTQADLENDKRRRKVLVAAFLHTFAVSLVLPALGPLVEEDIFDDDGSAASLFLSVVSAGSSLIEFISNPLEGAASDQYGRKPFLLMGLYGSLFSFILIGSLVNKASVVIAGVVRGITSIAGAMMYAMIVDVSKDAQRDSTAVTKNTGMMLAAASVGLALGPVAGGTLAFLGNRYSFLGAAVFETVAICYVHFVVPETLHTSIVFNFRDNNPFSSLRILCGSRHLTLLTAVFIFGTMPFGVYIQAPFWTESRFGWEAFDIGLVLAFGGIILVVIQGVGVKYVTPRYGEYNTLVLAFSCGIAQFALLGLSPYGWMWYVVIAVTCPYFLAAPSFRGLMSKSVDESVQGRLQGGISALSTLTLAVAPLAGSAMFVLTEDESPLDDDESRHEFRLDVAIVFFYGSGLALIGLIFSLLLRRIPLVIVRPTDGARAPGREVEMSSGTKDVPARTHCPPTSGAPPAPAAVVALASEAASTTSGSFAPNPARDSGPIQSSTVESGHTSNPPASPT